MGFFSQDSADGRLRNLVCPALCEPSSPIACRSHQFVENFGWYGTFFETTYFAWFPVLDAITTSLTQVYAGHRAWQLNDHKWVFLIVVNALLLVSFGGAVWTKVQLAQFDHLVEALRTRRRRESSSRRRRGRRMELNGSDDALARAAYGR